jgi:hypothetical protein
MLAHPEGYVAPGVGGAEEPTAFKGGTGGLDEIGRTPDSVGT